MLLSNAKTAVVGSAVGAMVVGATGLGVAIGVVPGGRLTGGLVGALVEDAAGLDVGPSSSVGDAAGVYAGDATGDATGVPLAVGAFTEGERLGDNVVGCIVAEELELFLVNVTPNTAPMTAAPTKRMAAIINIIRRRDAFSCCSRRAMNRTLSSTSSAEPGGSSTGAFSMVVLVFIVVFGRASFKGGVVNAIYNLHTLSTNRQDRLRGIKKWTVGSWELAQISLR